MKKLKKHDCAKFAGHAHLLFSSEHDYSAPNYKYLLSRMPSSDESAHFMIYDPVAARYPRYPASPFTPPALVTDTFRQIAESRDSTLGAALCARAALGSAIYLNYNCKACGRKNDPSTPSPGTKNEPLTPSLGLTNEPLTPSLGLKKLGGFVGGEDFD